MSIRAGKAEVLERCLWVIGNESPAWIIVYYYSININYNSIISICTQSSSKHFIDFVSQLRSPLLIPFDHPFDLLLIHHIHVILLDHLVLTHLRHLHSSLLLSVPDLVLMSLTLQPLLNPLKLLERPHVHLRVHEFCEVDTVGFSVSHCLLPLRLSLREVSVDLAGEVV